MQTFDHCLSMIVTRTIPKSLKLVYINGYEDIEINYIISGSYSVPLTSCTARLFYQATAHAYSGKLTKRRKHCFAKRGNWSCKFLRVWPAGASCRALGSSMAARVKCQTVFEFEKTKKWPTTSSGKFFLLVS